MSHYRDEIQDWVQWERQMFDHAVAIILRVFEGRATPDDLAAERAFTFFPTHHW